MYCEKCGAENSNTAVYCRKCGVPIERSEIETRVAARPPVEIEKPASEKMNGVEREIFSIAPTMKFVKAGYAAAAIIAVFFVGLISAVLSSYVPIWVAVIFGLLLFLVPAYYHIRQKFVRYTLSESKMEIDSGFISRSTRNVPIKRIQDVTVSASPWQRLLGIGDLVIDNASDDGGKTVLKNIDTPKRYADELLEQMRRLER
jgi:uncharacterized membrane protein YdbT with pleckstrin-like domain